MEAMAKLTEKQLIAALKRLERNWPDGFWLFVDGMVHLMECGEAGERVYEGDGTSLKVDQSYKVTQFAIPSEGGDW